MEETTAKEVKVMIQYSRKEKILKFIVEQFIEKATPVGSHTLIDEYDLPYSSATVRNEMLELEQAGYLEKPHTSAGRIPSTKGYRYYVENLRDLDTDDDVKEQMNELFSTSDMAINDIIKHGCEIIAQMTNLTSVVLGPDSSQEVLNKIQYVPLSNNSAVAVFVTSRGHVESKTFNAPNGANVNDIGTCIDILNDRLVGTPITEIIDKIDSIRPILAQHIVQHEVIFKAFLEAFMKFTTEHVNVYGRNNILTQPEFTSDIRKLKKLVKLVENDSVWRRLIGDGEHISVKIGEENYLSELDDVSLVTKTIKLTHNEVGTIALIGPTRMDYNKAIQAMEYLAKRVEDLLIEREDKNDTKK